MEEPRSSMDPAARLLDLLTLLAARPWWTGDALCERLEVTDRTLRRDVTRLRLLGYPVEGVTGPAGGYRLGAGGRLPPLVLDDDEAVAVAVALRAAAGDPQGGTGGPPERSADGGADQAILTALTKLDQVLPPRLRERVAALRAVTVPLRRSPLPGGDPEALVRLAVACRVPERVRFTYRDASGRVTERLVEPFRLVAAPRAWYLVAYDLDRVDWRTFRLDRLEHVVSTGQRFTRHEEPDAAALVSEGLAVGGWSVQCRVLLHVPEEEARRIVARTEGVVEPGPDPSTSTVRIGGDLDWMARYLVALACPFEVLEPPELRATLRSLGRSLVQAHREPRAPIG